MKPYQRNLIRLLTIAIISGYIFLQLINDDAESDFKRLTTVVNSSVVMLGGYHLFEIFSLVRKSGKSRIAKRLFNQKYSWIVISFLTLIFWVILYQILFFGVVEIVSDYNADIYITHPSERIGDPITQVEKGKVKRVSLKVGETYLMYKDLLSHQNFHSVDPIVVKNIWSQGKTLRIRLAKNENYEIVF